MTIRTAEESLLYYNGEMGNELGSLFHHINQELCWISSIWDTYETIFDTKQGVELFNHAAGGFAFKTQTIFFEYVILGICRLTDKKTVAGKKVLSICALPDAVRADLRDDVQALVNDSLVTARSHRDWRNRKISHSDLKRKLNRGKPLEKNSRIATTEAILKIHQVIAFICAKYCNSDLRLMEIGNDDGINILFELLRAQYQRELQENARKEGNYKKHSVEFPAWLVNDGTFTRYDPDRIAKVPRD